MTNIGFGLAATHTQGSRNRYTSVPSGPIEFPVKHPPYILRDSDADEYTQKTVFRTRPLAPIKRVLKQLVGRLTS